jgi:hypothetical protein
MIMKTLFKSTILLAVAGLSFFTSCKDDNDSNPTLTQPTTFVLNELSVTGNIDLEKTTEPITLTWSQPTPYNNFNAPVVPTYWVEISPTGQFTKAYDASAEDNTGADYFVLDETFSSGQKVEVNAQNLNRSMLQMLGWTETTTPAIQKLSVRVKAAVRDASFNEYFPIYSNVITMNTIPYYLELKPADPEIWWLIGSDIADGSWGSDIGKSVIPLQTIEDESYDMTTGQGKIQWKGYLAGNGFKLRGSLDDGWATQWGQGSGFGDYVKNDGGSGNITVPSAGLYTVSLDTQNDVLTIEPITTTPPVFDGMAISGSFNGWSDTEMTPCSTANENHDWYIEFTFSDGDEVKIKQAGSWDYNSGGEIVEREDGFYVYGGQGAANIYIAEGGDYMILYNDITRYIRFIKK